MHWALNGNNNVAASTPLDSHNMSYFNWHCSRWFKLQWNTNFSSMYFGASLTTSNSYWGLQTGFGIHQLQHHSSVLLFAAYLHLTWIHFIVCSTTLNFVTQFGGLSNMRTPSQVQVWLQHMDSCCKSHCGVSSWCRGRLCASSSPFISQWWHTLEKKVSLQRLPENFMRIRGIIKCNRKLMCGQNPYEGCARLQVRLDICFMAAEHDWAGWIKPHKLIRGVNDPWQILLVPAAPLVLIQSLPWLCGREKAVYNLASRDETALWVNSWSTTFSAAWSMASVLQSHPCESGSTVELLHSAHKKHDTGRYECY